LTLKGGASLTPAARDDIYQEIDDLLLPYMLDLSIFTQIGNPDWVDHINRVGKPLYRKTAAAPED
jgi:hypothetical protein